MGAGGTYPSYPYPNNNTGFNRPPYHSGMNSGGYYPPGPMNIPPGVYPPNAGMGGYGRGFHRPYGPMNYGPMIRGNGFQPGVFHPQMGGGGPGFFNSPRGNPAGLQAAPPSVMPGGNIHLHRPGEVYRPHFDHQ